MLTHLEKSLVEVSKFLKKMHVPHMVIGGVANLFWGNPRTTQDIDITIQIPDSRIDDLLKVAVKKFEVLVKNPDDFIKQTRVLPLRTRSGIRIDIIFALLPYEESAIAKAKLKVIGKIKIPICSAEDLILHKIISERPRDHEDVREILKHQRGKLDERYLKTYIEALSRDLERPEILEHYLEWK